MSVMRVGSSQKFADNWDNIFGGGKKSSAKSASKPAKAKPAKAKAAKSKSTKKSAATPKKKARTQRGKK